jgi:predicted AlkP superfamily phosphohydrolase/phosphomutase
MQPNEKLNSRPPRVLVIGFDGATLALIRPWAEAGLLPTFRRLLDESAAGVLESTMPPVTPAAWSSMTTGLNQGKHGLYDFFARRQDSYESYVVNSTHRHGVPLWQLLSEAGKRVTVINVPATYPPDPVNGLMVSGLLTPGQATDAASPPELLEELKAAVPDFGFYPPGVFSKGQEMEFINDVLEWDQMTLRATRYLMERQEWDFLFTVFSGVDIMSHFMWRAMEEGAASNSSKSPGDDQSAPASAIQRIYQQADSILAELLQAAGPDSYVMVVSDHGFGPLDYYLHLNAWLIRKGYIKFRRNLHTQAKALLYHLGLTPLRMMELLRRLHLGGQIQSNAKERNEQFKALVKQVFLSLDDIDWERTTAYSAGYGGPIFVNLKGREPQGIVSPGAEYDTLLDRLTADLQTVRHPYTQELCFGEMYRSQQLYSGPYLNLAPDLLVLPRDWSTQGYGVHDFASNRWLEPSPDRSGTHRMDGVFFLNGPGVAPHCTLEPAAIWDVTPTVLALMGTPIPDNLDGQVLTAALTPELLDSLSISYRAATAESKEQAVPGEMAGEDELRLRRHLQALGYYNLST